MTIAAAYITPEGIVLGADSTSTISALDQAGQPQVVQLLNHAQKVFEIGPRGKGNYGVCTWGAGIVGRLSHRTVVAQAASAILATDTVEQAKDKFVAIVVNALQSAGQNEVLGYFFAGINPASYEPECWELLFENGAPVCNEKLQIGTAKFAGAPEFFTRVFHGFAPSLPAAFLAGLKAADASLNKPEFDALFMKVFDDVRANICVGGFHDLLPLREAIDYVHTYLHLTIKAFKFRAGPPVCGGPIEIGFITTDRPFRWVCHKDFDTAILEQKGGMNV